MQSFQSTTTASSTTEETLVSVTAVGMRIGKFRSASLTTSSRRPTRAVTVRDRDTMEQVRVPIAELKNYFEDKFRF